MSKLFIRPYDPSRDFDHGLHVFFATIDPGLDYEPARTIGSYLWYKPHVSLTPSTCFVLDDGTGRVVGYCIGCTDTTTFAQRWRDEFAPTVDPAKVPRPGEKCDVEGMEKDDVKGFRHAVYNGECSMLHEWPEVLGRKGYGRKLIEAFFERVKRNGADGVHLDMVRHNVNARAFYERIGFQICPHVLDRGASGETGVNGIVATLVKTL
ncbi:GCN5-related N-acetyltransferas-like protein [Ampelomyces quisqualis]|uniref:GCN5-related N-acetyltransferas-like protein n=1 Tax=Ampelomyces quisqualis TaxID=50730 RepID=A0A6A5QLD4_AMPQU|nr:GCN5-related N-acetyltransferas-like protein [Ampelomyces quisqualis]